MEDNFQILCKIFEGLWSERSRKQHFQHRQTDVMKVAEPRSFSIIFMVLQKTLQQFYRTYTWHASGSTHADDDAEN